MTGKHLSRISFLFLSVFYLMGCTEEKVSSSGVQVIELQRENNELRSELKLVTDALSTLEKAQDGFVTQQVVGEPVKYMDKGRTLEDVLNRKVLICGGNADLPGFGYLDPDSSSFIGFDIDFCRAIAAAVLGEQGSNQIEIIPLTSRLRFAALQAGEVDVLTRNTTWTMTRDAEMRANYTGVNFYDGQGIMVRKQDEIRKLSDLQNKSVCVQSGSTSATNVADYFFQIGIPVEVQQFDERVAALKQYEDKVCDGYTGDKTSLLAQRTLLSEPAQHIILHKEISREPLGPLVRHNDDNWQDIVRWTLQCMLNAEFEGLSQENIIERLASESEFVNQALGIDSQLGRKMGLADDFCLQVIKQVGNYKDVYERHLGPETELDLPRGLNALFVDGGLHYPLPFR